MTTPTLSLILALTLPLAAAAQKMWTMDECIAYALEHSANVKVRALTAKGALADRQQAAASFLPNVSAQIGGQFSWGRGIDPETNTYTTVTNFNNSEGVYASWTTFDGGRSLYQFRQACLAQREAQNSLQQARDETALEVMQAYVDAAYAQGCRDLARQRLDEVSEELRRARLQEELGTLGRPDVALIEAQEADAQYTLSHQEAEEERTRRALLLKMTHPLSTSPEAKSFLISLTSEVAGEPNLPLMDEVRAGEGVMIPKAIQAHLSVEQAVLAKKLATSHFFPTLTISAGLSTGYYRTIGNGYTARPFKAQVRENIGKYVSATLSFPIFGCLSRLTSLRKAKYNLASAQILKDETLRRLSHETLQAASDCRQGALEVEALTRKVEADSLAYSLASRRFAEGLLTAQDLIASYRELQDSRIRLLQARLTLVVRRRGERYLRTGEITSGLFWGKPPYPHENSPAKLSSLSFRSQASMTPR